RESVTDEPGDGVVKAVRQSEGCSPFAVGFAVAGADSSEEISGGPRFRSFGERPGDELPTVVVRPAGKNFPPRFRMRRRKIVAIGQLLDFFGREPGKKLAPEHAEEGIAQTVDALEMLEEQDQPFQVRRFKLAIDAVERMRDGMRDPVRLQITLQIENIVAHPGDVRVLRFRDSPDQEMDLAGILREV